MFALHKRTVEIAEVLESPNSARAGSRGQNK